MHEAVFDFTERPPFQGAFERNLSPYCIHMQDETVFMA